MEIVINPSEVLRAPTAPIESFDRRLHRIAQKMVRTMKRNNGIGLAAPQVDRSIKLIVCSDGSSGGDCLIMCNPEITASSGQQIDLEGCLSIPDTLVEVRRAQSVTCRFQDLKGQWQTVEVTGLLARCVQHELDHLNGKLIIDYM